MATLAQLAELAPPGIECHFVNIWRERPLITPRGLLIHTNGASVESNLQSQLNWANAAHDNTKPHYVVDRKGKAWKTLPSNRKGIANYLADAFFLSIETTDLGWPKPGGAVGFTDDQAETVARIAAWESALWDFPIVTPTAWDGTGVASHTDPFTYPHWTKYQGKACPGPTKKLEVRTVILPRARAIRYPSQVVVLPDPPTQKEDDMPAARIIRLRGYANAYIVGAGPVTYLTGELYTSLQADGVPVVDVDATDRALAAWGIDRATLVPL